MIRGTYIKQIGDRDLSTATELFLGAISGASSQFFTLPIAVVTTRQQTSPLSERLDFVDTTLQIVKEDGIQGLWRGINVTYEKDCVHHWSFAQILLLHMECLSELKVQ